MPGWNDMSAEEQSLWNDPRQLILGGDDYFQGLVRRTLERLAIALDRDAAERGGPGADGSWFSFRSALADASQSRHWGAALAAVDPSIVARYYDNRARGTVLNGIRAGYSLRYGMTMRQLHLALDVAGVSPGRRTRYAELAHLLLHRLTVRRDIRQRLERYETGEVSVAAFMEKEVWDRILFRAEPDGAPGFALALDHMEALDRRITSASLALFPASECSLAVRILTTALVLRRSANEGRAADQAPRLIDVRLALIHALERGAIESAALELQRLGLYHHEMLSVFGAVLALRHEVAPGTPDLGLVGYPKQPSAAQRLEDLVENQERFLDQCSEVAWAESEPRNGHMIFLADPRRIVVLDGRARVTVGRRTVIPGSGAAILPVSGEAWRTHAFLFNRPARSVMRHPGSHSSTLNPGELEEAIADGRAIDLGPAGVDVNSADPQGVASTLAGELDLAFRGGVAAVRAGRSRQL